MLACLPGVVAAQQADIAFINGTIHTMDTNRPTVEAIAISGQQISYVGSDNGAQSLIGADTKVIDLEGKWCSPGL